MNKHLHVSDISFPSDVALHHLLDREAKRNPDKVALVFRHSKMTYLELASASDRLANHLISLGIKKEDFVALYLERSLEIIVGIFGILKAGGAYVPIDVDYPKERMAFMVKDAQAKVILTQKHLKSSLPTSPANIVCLDENLPVSQEQSTANQQFTPNQLAYMIYTSGSTGKPKGVMISHENVCNQLEGQQEIAPDPIGTMMLTCSISFDVSVLTIFWTLLQGATLVLPEQGEEKDMAKLANTIFRNRVTHILTLPSLYTLLLEQADPDKLQTLKLVNVSGEVCPVSLAQKHEDVIPNGQLYNLYGPTEATVNCTYFTFPKGYAESKAPIGIPILNYEILILNEKMEEVTRGEVGEIYIGGTKPVVGRGYWNRPELTEERFCPLPTSPKRGGESPVPFERIIGKLYKTGDLARWMPDGNIEFLGRSDFQVKYRGFRIELGEVESAISNHPSVKETVVLLKNEHEVNNQKLVAYLTVNQGLVLSVSELRNFLSDTLPEYMLPSHFVFLEKMPLTTNGKFDRKALPEPANERPILADQFEAPETDLERMIATKWEAILEITPIGRNDKFFELGGTSIQAAKFIGEMMKELDTSIFITSIFDYPTIASFAQFLEKNYTSNNSFLHSKNVKLESHEQAGSDQSSHLILTQKQIEEFPQFVPSHLTRKSSISEKPDPDVSPIFILAPPRTGTTLLRVMLAGHPDLFACNELQLLHFQTLAEREEAFSGKFKLWSEGLIRAIMELKNIPADEAKSLLLEAGKAGGTTHQMFADLQEWSGGKTIVDKSPSYLLDPKALQKAIHDFPNARFIHLVRHPYSMVKSFEKYHIAQALYLKEHNLNEQQLGELVWLWSNKNAVEFLKEVPEKQQFRIIYEDLVKQPERVMKEMCGQIDLDFHPNLLNPYSELDKKMTDGIYENSRSMGDNNFDKKKKIDAQKANDWKGILNDNFLHNETQELAASFGYEVGDRSQVTGVRSQESGIRGQGSGVRNEEPKTKNKERRTENEKQSDIAIIGMACRFPGANTLEEFWENLVGSKDVSKKIIDVDLEEEGITPKGKFICKAYALNDPYSFDASFFGMLPKEATMTDPQHRVFLETAYQAIEVAGYDPFSFDGKIGLFGGVAKNTYFTNNILTNPTLLEEAGGYKEMLASESSFSITRIAYMLNLRGPAVNVQTACSTGGVAVHLGCQSILAGDSDMVIVGGGRIQPNLNVGYEYVEGGPLSADGTCRAFDERADGMVQGNGMGMLVLKKLDKAIEDGDHIWATIKSTAINNDGADKTGITAPSSKGQSACIAEAIEKAGLTSNQIGYFETHGTGTFIGDPIEIQGLTDAVSKTSNSAKIPIGSVKTNIGHLDAGACIAGIIKTALSLQHGMLPPSLHYISPNPQLRLEQSPFYVNQELQPWLTGKEPRRAGVSSFGLGGTNAHIILEESPIQVTKSEADNVTPQLLIISGKTDESVNAISDNLSNFLKGNELPQGDVAKTLAFGRPHFKKRKALIIEDGKAIQVPIGQPTRSIQNIFMFPGGGAQYEGMAQDLYSSNAYFKDKLDACFQILLEKHGLDIRKAIFPNGTPKTTEDALITKPSFALPALFSLEYALAKLWKHWGIEPDLMIGHSMGEYAAACFAGVMKLEDALGLVAVRGKLFDSLEVDGGMLSVAASEEQVSPFLDDIHTISVINKKDSIVISSTNTGIDELKLKLESNGIECSKIHIAVPAHSPLIDPIIDDFRKYLQTVDLQAPKIPFVSNVTGNWITSEEATDPEYWIRHIRQTVRFAEGLETLIDTEYANSKKRIFLEVGPGQTLSTFARAIPTLQNEERLVVASVRHPKEVINDVSFIYKTAGRLWTNGANIQWENFFGTEKFNRIPLPAYPFAKTKYFIKPGKPFYSKSQSDNTIEKSASWQPSEFTQSPSMEITTRIPTLISEIKQSLYELSGVELSDMDENSTFLELGFDSLFLSQAVIKFNYKFSMKLSFRMLFEEAPSIGSLAELIDKEIPEDLFKPRAEEKLQSLPNTSDQVAFNAVSPTIPPFQSNGNGEQVELLIQQQLSIMQQQLNLLRGESLQTPSIPIAQNLTKPTYNPKVEQAVNGKEQEVEIKRTAKGVTAKMGNYKKIGTDNELSPRQQKGLEELILRYNKITKKSKELSQKHRQYYADPRSVTGFSKLWKEICYQIAHEKSKGSKIWDVDGNEYIDYVMSYGVALFGHMPDFVENAVTEAIRKGNSIDLLPPEATEMARTICKLTGYDRVTLANTGTEAVLGAVRAARTATGKDRIAVFDTDYHGMIDQFMVRGINLKGKNKTLPGSPGIPKFMVENTLTLDYDDPEVLQKLENEIADLAAVVIEPVQAQNPHWQHRELIQNIRQLTEKHGVALIFDEIINGFRMHQRGAQGWYGVDADISAYGKSISGGLPVAAVAGKAKYMDAFDGGVWNYGDESSPDGVITYFASTFIKNPISVAAGYAAIKEIERLGPSLQEDLNDKTIRFAEKIKEIFLRTKAPFMIQSASSFFMLKYVDGSPLNRLFNYFLRLRGVNVRERPCFISTAHTEEDFEKTYKGFELAIADMFEAGLIEPYDGEDLNIIIRQTDEIDMPVMSDDIPKVVQLTEGQQEIFLSNQISEEASKAYNISTQIRLAGPINLQKLEASLLKLVSRHEALRTVFNADGKTQTVLPELAVEVPFVDLSNENGTLSDLHNEEAEHLFDLENGPLVRFKIVRLEEDVHLVFITVHHIICDGWSLGILTKELGELYGGKTPETTKQLSQYALEQAELQNSDIYEENEDYWLNEYSGEIPHLDLPSDFQRPPVRTYQGGIEKITFEPAFAAQIRKAAAKNGSTFYVFMLAAYQAYLSRISGQADLIMGIAAAGHNLPGNQNLVAHAIGLLPVRTKKDEGITFKAYLKAVRNKVLDAFDHQQFTFGSLVKKLKINRSANRNTLVNVAFNFDSPLDNLFFGNLKAETQAIRRHYETFDTFINLKPIGDRVDFEWNFNTDLFKHETIKLRLEEFKIFLQDILEDAEKPITGLRLLPDFESQQLAAFGKGEQADFPVHQCLHELFDQQAKQTPSNIAVELTTGEKLSYQELENYANSFANALVEKGIQAGDFVGLCVDRSLEMLIGIYGILKAGAAYVPIDPRNPKERIKFILDDTNCKVLLTQPQLLSYLPDFNGSLLLLNEQNLNGSVGKAKLSTNVLPQSPAYVIYTSGSTGQPKGVVVRHENAVNTLFAINEYWQMQANDVVYSVSSMSFDMSIPDYFLTLIKGGKLVLADELTKKDGFALKESIEKYNPHFMQATPTTWKILTLSGWKGSDELTVIAGGEGFPKSLASQMANSCKAVWNGYGPTETTIYATYQKVTEEHLSNCQSEIVAIGSPIANTQMIILDKEGEQVPIGVAGELFIGGKGVSSGYLNRAELTNEKFSLPSNSNKGRGENANSNQEDRDGVSKGAFYRTGDLVRYLATGEIEFLGRIDDQVKIRGYRIEIGEIEESIKKHSAVLEAAVNVFKDNTESSQLAAYVVWENEPDIERLKSFLKMTLPGFMIPSAFVEMTSLPTNTSLKVDRKALPKPSFTTKQETVIEEPSTKGEQLLTGLWKDLLGVGSVSVQDDFFELGGHSLAAVQLMSKIKEATGKKLPLTTLFQNSTIKKLAVQLNGYNKPIKNSISKNGTSKESYSSLICIRKGGDKPPLYLVHGGGLHVLFYQNLVKHLDKDQPIYALQAKGLNPGEEPLDRIEEMAAHYIKEIQLQNPNGQYCLAGYSLGGLIAWEMAAQLKAENREVPLLALFDAVAKYEWAGSGNSGNMKKKMKKLGFNLSLLVKEPGKAIEYKSSVLKMQLQHMKGKLTMAYRNNKTNEIEEGYLPYGKEVYEKSLEAYDKYELKPLDIHIDLFKAKEQMFYLHDPVNYGWDLFAEEGITTHEIEGNHMTLFDEPHGQQVAEALGKRLEEIRHKNQKLNILSV